MEKSIDNVIFYCKNIKEGRFAKQYKGKQLCPAWPKLLHQNSEAAIFWATRVPGPNPEYFTVTMPNLFENAEVLDDIDSRGQSAKIPQAAIYCAERDCYLEFDFRADGIVETACHGSMKDGFITTPMSFRIVGSNYYFVPTNGPSFAEYKKEFEQNNKPKEKQTTQVEVGVPFIGANSQPYVYLGEFDCTRDDTAALAAHYILKAPDFADSKVHVYHSCRKSPAGDAWSKEARLSISKTKMTVKSLEIPDDVKISMLTDTTSFNTSRISKSGCTETWGCRVFVDFEARTVEFAKAYLDQTQDKEGGWVKS